MRLLQDAGPFWAIVALFSTLVAADPSIAMDYCASVNTAQTPSNHSIYQSDGLCHDFCVEESYALAIVQSEYCWCSNYVPDSGSQESLDNCEESCPGFPSDYCGGDGTFGYMTLEVAVSGTTTIAQSTTKAASTTSTTSKSSQTSQSTTSTTEAPAVQTVTVGGTVQTVTATPTAVVGSPNTGDISAKHNGSSLSTGQAVGLAIGVVALAVIAVAGAVFWWLRRRRRQREAEAAAGGFDSQRGSSAGMMQTPKSAGTGDLPQFIFTTNSRNVGDNYDSDPLGRRRSGMLRPIDPRLDPVAAGIYSGENKSRDSINTIRDDQDYSRKVHQPGRVLRATNPDPDDDD